MKRTGQIVFACLSLAIITMPEAARAQAVTEIGTNGVWSAYAFTEGNHKVCYIIAQPSHSEGNYTHRGDIYALVTHRPSQGDHDVVSIMAGYPYKSSAQVQLVIGARAFTLIGHDETAWAQGADERDLIAAMKAGRGEMVVTGSSQRGTRTVDTFGLAGFTASYALIEKACPRRGSATSRQTR